jgi:hypothetical protein
MDEWIELLRFAVGRSSHRARDFKVPKVNRHIITRIDAHNILKEKKERMMKENLVSLLMYLRARHTHTLVYTLVIDNDCCFYKGTGYIELKKKTKKHKNLFIFLFCFFFQTWH